MEENLHRRLDALRMRLKAGPVRDEDLRATVECLEEIAQAIERLENSQRTMDAHIAAIEQSLIFRFLRRVGRPLLEWNARLRRNHPADAAQYRAWLQQEEAKRPPMEDYRRQAEAFRRHPRFRLIVPRNELILPSLREQTYPHWELEAGADAPDYFVFSNGMGTLSPVAVHEFAAAVQDDAPELIYTDEDRIDAAGHPLAPVFKPGWSPDLLDSCFYLGSLVAVSREAIEAAGGIRPAADAAQMHDLVLRAARAARRVRHIPHVLYHGRGSAEPAAVEPLRHTLDGEPLASLIICSRSARLLDQCLRAIARETAYPAREIVVVQHVTGDDGGMEAVLSRHGIKQVVPYKGPFHFSRMNNAGAQAASGAVLVFLNDDIEPLTRSWLGSLMAQAMRPEIGVAGARLLYPSGTIQHAGVAIGIGDGCGHPGRGTYGSPYWKWLSYTRNVSAVTGACLAIRAEVFRQAGGFDDRFPVNYNDTDLCLRVAEAGYRILYESAAVLRHYECQTRAGMVKLSEREQWYARWSGKLRGGDPFYSPNLTHVREDASLRFEE